MTTTPALLFPRRSASTLLSAFVLLALSAAVGQADSPTKRLNEDQRILLALNRLAFGPRPGDLEAVKKIGLQRWIDAQLSPEKIDDAVVEQKLAALPTLKMAPQEMFDNFKEDQMQIRQRIQAMGGAPGAGQPPRPDAGQMPPGTAPPRLYAAPPMPGQTGDGMAMSPQMQMQQMGQRPANNAIEALGELNNSKLLRACESNRQLQEVLVDFWSNHFNVDVKKGQVRAFKPIEDRDAIRPHVLGKFRDLLEADAKSPAMLLYLDNATSARDFNDPNGAPPARFRPGFRPGAGLAPGGFGGPNMGMRAAGGQGAGAVPQRPGGPGAAQRRGGLNENYGRELLELHTMGVDGGYTQKDVQEVARCFTGWSIDRQSGTYRFFPFLHDYGQKTVLGHTIAAGGGIEDGEKVLDIVASHPATARFIATKLCQRFVSDTPPAELVERAAQTFQKSGGDIREVVRTIVSSRDFLAPQAYRSKMKSPFEFAVSAVRALGGTFEIPDPNVPAGRLRLVADGAVSMGRGPGAGGRQGFPRASLAQEIATMGQPLFSHEAPTGYPEDSREWVSSGSLLARFNFAQDLTSGRVAQVTVTLPGAGQPIGIRNPKGRLTSFSRAVFGEANLSDTTRSAILHELETGADQTKVTALLLGSPEFQHR